MSRHFAPRARPARLAGLHLGAALVASALQLGCDPSGEANTTDDAAGGAAAGAGGGGAGGGGAGGGGAGGGGGDEADGGPETADGGPEGEPITLRFVARANGSPAVCGATLEGLGSPPGPVRLRDLRLYLSELSLVDAAGRTAPFTLDDDGRWQNGSVGLLDFEDGTGLCAESGTPDLNTALTGTAPAGDWTGVRFTLGVPAELNHQDSALAPAPLNITPMFWVWQSGYKFARIDLENGNEAPRNRWNIHLGSTGCASATPVNPPDGACGRPNRARIQIDGYNPQTDHIVFDLGALLATADVTADTPDSPPGCMSAPTEPDDCSPLFDALGLDFANGEVRDCALTPAGCGGAPVFRAEAAE